MQTHTRPTPAPIPPQAASSTVDARHLERVERHIGRKSFAVLSTVSEAGFPHAAGVAYAAAGSTLYVNTLRTSRKARNVAGDDRVAVVIPVRTLPVGPPFTIQFQGRADVLAMDEPEITDLVARGALTKITSHGELAEPDGCFLRIRPTGLIHTYGLGVSVLAVARDPLHNGARSVHLT